MRARVASGAALAAVIAFGLRPFLFAIPLWPTSRDAALWITRGMPGTPGWAEWVFLSRHFVGYRPVTASSYTLNTWLFGLSAVPLRAVDFLLHAGCCVLVHVLFRRLAPDLPRWGGWLAAFIFAIHPLSEQIVPELGRRSYPLSTLLGLAALILASRAAGSGGAWRRSSAVGVVLVAALGANETALALLPVIALMAWRAARPDRPPRAIVEAAAIPAGLALGWLALRAAVIGGAGGYLASSESVERADLIAGATWSALAGLVPARGAPSSLEIATGLALGLYLVWRSVPRRRADVPGSSLALLLLAWLASCTLLFAPLGAWFPRQVYPAVVPLALLVAVLAVRSVVDLGGWRRAIALAPLIAWIAALVAISPAVRGADPGRVAAWRATDAMLRVLDGSLASIEGPSDILLAVPLYRGARARSRSPHDEGQGAPLGVATAEIWTRALNADRDDLAIGTLLVFDADALSPGAAAVSVVDDRGGPGVLVPDGVRHWRRAGARVEKTAAGTIVRPRRVAPRRASWLLFYDGSAARPVPLAARPRPGDDASSLSSSRASIHARSSR